MKTHLFKAVTLIVLNAIFIFPSLLYCQQSEPAAALSEKLNGKVLTFTAKVNSGKVYLSWTTACLDLKGLFVIERSINNEKFQIIGVKENIASPVNVKLLYCFTDAEVEATASSVRYKLSWLDINSKLSTSTSQSGIAFTE